MHPIPEHGIWEPHNRASVCIKNNCFRNVREAIELLERFEFPWCNHPMLGLQINGHVCQGLHRLFGKQALVWAAHMHQVIAGTRHSAVDDIQTTDTRLGSRAALATHDFLQCFLVCKPATEAATDQVAHPLVLNQNTCPLEIESQLIFREKLLHNHLGHSSHATWHPLDKLALDVAEREPPNINLAPKPTRQFEEGPVYGLEVSAEIWPQDIAWRHTVAIECQAAAFVRQVLCQETECRN